MQDKARIIAAPLIEVDGEIIQQALDFMTTSGRKSVTFMIFNGKCIGLDTATDAVSSSQPMRRVIEVASDPGPGSLTLDAITQEFVISALSAMGRPATAGGIADHQSIPKNNLPIRQKIWRMCAKLKAAGVLTMARDGHYTVGPRRPKALKAVKNIPPAETIPEILAILKEGQSLAMQISDRLGYDRKDQNARIRVSRILRTLVANKIVNIVGTTNGIMPVYELAETPDNSRNVAPAEQSV